MDMKQWKDNETGVPATPMGTDNLNKLKKSMGEFNHYVVGIFLTSVRTACGLETDNTCPTEFWG